MRAQKQQLGVPRDAWFVCLHAREAGYLPELTYHSYRNVDIMSYLPAVEAIVARGGWVIRMGDPTMTPLPRMRQVVDYAHSGFKSDWMDVFCLARCRFLLGDSSGPLVVSFVFGVPCALANLTPLGDAPYSARDIWIPKRYRLIREDRDLTCAEILQSSWRNLHRTQDYEAAGIAWVDNAPEEIQELTEEILDRLEGRLSYTTEDERLQQRFKSLLESDSGWRRTARVGRGFLARHRRLLVEEAWNHINV